MAVKQSKFKVGDIAYVVTQGTTTDGYSYEPYEYESEPVGISNFPPSVSYNPTMTKVVIKEISACFGGGMGDRNYYNFTTPDTLIGNNRRCTFDEGDESDGVMCSTLEEAHNALAELTIGLMQEHESNMQKWMNDKSDEQYRDFLILQEKYKGYKLKED